MATTVNNSLARRHWRPLVLRVLSIAVLTAVQPWLWSLVHTTVTNSHIQRSQAQQLQAVNDRLDDIKRIDQKRAFDHMELVIPPRASLPIIIERIERVATEQNVTIKIGDIIEEVVDEESVVPQQLQPVRIHLQSTGTPGQLLRYIEALEHMQELTALEGWTLEPLVAPVASLTSSSAVTYNVQIVLLLYLHEPHAPQTAK